MIRLVTFNLPNMSISAAKLVESAYKHGFDEAICYTPEDIDPFFKQVMAEEISETLKGGWYYSWKPYAVLKAILRANVGDYLIYCDAGSEIISSVNDITGEMDDDIFLFSNGWNHVHWCKADVYNAINATSMKSTPTFGGNFLSVSDELANAKQTQASLIFFKVTARSIQFVKEWYSWSLMPGLINDDPSKVENHPEFQQHRYDQAILCSLQIKWGLKLHWFPSTYAFHIKQEYPDIYPPFILHHRKRDNEY